MTTRFKAATAELHREVETENLARFIMDHSIERETYELLLLQNYLAYKTTESAIASHIEGYKGNKHLLLAKDIENLQLERPELPLAFNCNSRAAAFGAAYVVEGSALGGLVLATHISKCPGLDTIGKHYFFNGSKENLANWNRFKEGLGAQDFSEEELDEAIQKAQDTFRFFQRIYSMQRGALQ